MREESPHKANHAIDVIEAALRNWHSDSVLERRVTAPKQSTTVFTDPNDGHRYRILVEDVTK